MIEWEPMQKATSGGGSGLMQKRCLGEDILFRTSAFISFPVLLTGPGFRSVISHHPVLQPVPGVFLRSSGVGN